MVVARLLRPARQWLFQIRVLPEMAWIFARELPKISFFRLPEEDRFIPEKRAFVLLHQTYSFTEWPDWQYGNFGLLWNFRLNGWGWLEAFDQAHPLVTALLHNRATAAMAQPALHPAALRLENGLRYWLAAPDSRTVAFATLLWNDYQRNIHLPETHLEGNHLLQNRIAAFQGSLFFGETAQQPKTAAKLAKTLKAQFLADGCHYERSISYTALLLGSLLKTLQLLRLIAPEKFSFLQNGIKEILAGGLGFLEEMAFSDGSFPAFGDSHCYLAPTQARLAEAAAREGILTKREMLRACGYRKRAAGVFEIAVQCGTAAPAFQPGHSHADATSFCLHIQGKPFIVDTGISTYARGNLRQHERSSEAHNVLTIAGQNTSEVWAAFRMGRRATVEVRELPDSTLELNHNGYRFLGVKVLRRLELSETMLRITDECSSRASDAVAWLHFHPDVGAPVQPQDQTLAFPNGVSLRFEGAASIAIIPYEWCEGFNLRRPATCVRITLQDTTLITHLSIPTVA